MKKDIIAYIKKLIKIDVSLLKPGKKDIIGAIIAFPCLLITGFIIGFLASRIGSFALPVLYAPAGAVSWIILCISLFLLAYLEEFFFRFYILSKRKEMNLSVPYALALSTILFGLFHIYLGPLGVINAIICGFLLGVIFLRYGSFHGISIAHGLYNITAYIVSVI